MTVLFQKEYDFRVFECPFPLYKSTSDLNEMSISLDFSYKQLISTYFHTSGYENIFIILRQNMMSHDTDDVIRRNVDDLPCNAKTSMNIHQFLSKFYNIFALVRIVAE